MYIIDRKWNKISSTFGKCTHCGHQSEELGCIVDHKVCVVSLGEIWALVQQVIQIIACVNSHLLTEFGIRVDHRVNALFFLTYLVIL